MYQLNTFGVNSFRVFYLMPPKKASPRKADGIVQMLLGVSNECVSRINCYCGEAHRSTVFPHSLCTSSASVGANEKCMCREREKKKEVVVARQNHHFTISRTNATPRHADNVDDSCVWRTQQRHLSSIVILRCLSCLIDYDYFIFLCISCLIMWIDILIRLQREWWVIEKDENNLKEYRIETTQRCEASPS